MKPAALALVLSAGCTSPAPPAAQPEPSPPATATVSTPLPPPPTASASASPPVSSVPRIDIDFSRWGKPDTFCHPAETWTDEKGCVSQSKIPAGRCGNAGSKQDLRPICGCSPRDLMCQMHCGKPGKVRRVPRWDTPAPPNEFADCQKQCDADYAPGCLRLGLTFVRGTPKQRGMDLLERSCRLGYGAACYELFHLYRWLPESRKRPFAAQLEESLCNHTEDDSPCIQTAEAYRNGWGVKQDTEKAADYRELACERVKRRCKGKQSCIDDARVCL